MFDETENSKFTEHFLQLISAHLSDKPECRQVEYRVTITDSKHITLHDNYTVQALHGRGKKNREMKSGVVEHIIDQHFSNSNQYRGELIPGEYIYKLSINKKKRRWTRM